MEAQNLQLAAYHPDPRFFNFSSGSENTEYVVVSTFNSLDNWSAGSVTQFGVYVFNINDSQRKTASTATLSDFKTNFSAYPIIQVMKGVYSSSYLYYPMSLTVPLKSGLYSISITFNLNYIVQLGPYHILRDTVKVVQNVTLGAT